jgi:hypothetical protein
MILKIRQFNEVEVVVVVCLQTTLNVLFHAEGICANDDGADRLDKWEED